MWSKEERARESCPGRDYCEDDAMDLLRSDKGVLDAVYSYLQEHDNLLPEKFKEIVDSVKRLRGKSRSSPLNLWRWRAPGRLGTRLNSWNKGPMPI